MSTRKLIFAIVVAAASVFASTSALAQSGSGDATNNKQGTSTVILQFENMQVSQGVMDTFYRTLNDQINQRDDMHVVEGGEVTIQDLIVTVGCDQPDPKCLSGMNQYVDADRMVFGSVQRSGDAYLFSLKMFDFAEERFLRDVSEQSVEGDTETVKSAIPAVVEAFLYGETGSLNVSTTGSGEGSRVFFDGKKLGVAPTTMENLPLGQHAVTVRTSDGKEKTKFVILRHGEKTAVEFDIGPTKVSDKGSKGGAPILGYAITGIGVAGIVVGVAEQARNANLKSESNQLLCANGNAICPPPGSGMTRQEAADRAAELEKITPRSAYFSAAGYSVGAIGLGVGGYLLYRHYSSSPDRRSGDQAAVDSIRVQPRRGGASLGFSVDFR